MKVKVLSTQSYPTLCNLMDCSLPGFSRQEYWSGLPFPSPGDLPSPGIEPRSPALEADTLTSEPPGKPNTSWQIDEETVEIVTDFILEGSKITVDDDCRR